jgi:hypothetical protein
MLVLPDPTTIRERPGVLVVRKRVSDSMTIQSEKQRKRGREVFPSVGQIELLDLC